MTDSLRSFSLYQGLWRSFYCPKFYEFVARHWRGRGVLYLLLLSFITILPLVYILKVEMNQFIANEGAHILEQWPDVVIENGRASTRAEQPYFIYDHDGNRVMAIDTTGTLNHPKDAKVPILLTQLAIHTDINKDTSRTVTFEEVKYLLIDQTQMQDWWGAAQSLVLPLGIPILTASAFLYRLFQVCIYAVVAMVMVSVLQVKLTYPAAFQLAAVALTPSVALMFLIHGLGMNVPQEGLIIFATAMGFLWFGVRAATADQLPEKR